MKIRGYPNGVGVTSFCQRCHLSTPGHHVIRHVAGVVLVEGARQAEVAQHEPTVATTPLRPTTALKALGGVFLV